MIIGNGTIANAFIEYKLNDKVIIFASGVSDSSTTDTKEFIREKEMITDTIKNNENKLIVYFSSCSIESADLQNTLYNLHKKEMELLIINISKSYIIFRLPNVIRQNGNPNTIINFLFNKIKKEEEFDLWQYATRNIIDIEDIKKVVNYLVGNKQYLNRTINIVYNNNVSILNIVNIIENILDKKGKYNIVNRGLDVKFDNTISSQILENLNIKQPSLSVLINKYKTDKTNII